MRDRVMTTPIRVTRYGELTGPDRVPDSHPQRKRSVARRIVRLFDC